MNARWIGALGAAVVLLGSSADSIGSEMVADMRLEGGTARERCADRSPLRRAFFGDLHVHTAFSLDASTMGTRNRPVDAYRFARGGSLGIQPYDARGRATRELTLARPLDFAAVTDHSELLGEWSICNTPGLEGHDSLVCRIYRSWPRLAFFWMNFQASRATRHDFCGEGGVLCLEAAQAPWNEIRGAAEDAYDRSSACTFTSFVAYEWTGAAGMGNNFHRNVIFANDVAPRLPVSFVDVPQLTDFWSRLESDCAALGGGCDVLVIPHNSNLSAGRMFRTVEDDGRQIGRAEAQARARMEPLVEIMQHKGESECMYGLGTEDELCTFENLLSGNFSGHFFPPLAEPPVARQFVRNILKEGLALERELGVNPFRFGIVASTDTHLGAPGYVDESAGFTGHGGAGKPPDAQRPGEFPDHLDFNPGGLAVLWAEENSRASLFAALRRREAYGTSGPRIQLRFFGGWNYPDDLCGQPDFAAAGYESGVPMGGELVPRSGARSAEAPRFAVTALRDPGTPDSAGTPLQRIQIVKGWLDGDSLHERVFDVAGDPAPTASVDPDTCETRGPGADRLCAVWSDPAFDPTQPAFYYARVLENPTCRWSQQLCVASGVRCDAPESVPPGLEPCCVPEHVRSVQERAWSSPIWYRIEGDRSPSARARGAE